MTTENELRARGHNPEHRLLFALLDILTGVTEASVTQTSPKLGAKRYTFNVKKSGIQDD